MKTRPSTERVKIKTLYFPSSHHEQLTFLLPMIHQYIPATFHTKLNLHYPMNYQKHTSLSSLHLYTPSQYTGCSFLLGTMWLLDTFGGYNDLLFGEMMNHLRFQDANLSSVFHGRLGFNIWRRAGWNVLCGSGMNRGAKRERVLEERIKERKGMEKKERKGWGEKRWNHYVCKVRT